MKKLILTICLLPLALAVLSQEKYDSSFRFYYYDQKLSMFESMEDDGDEIVWLGDSITDGCEWSELFPGIKTCNRGISADNTFGVLNRLYEIVRLKPRKIFIMIGINDIARGIPDTVIVRNYRRIIDTLKKNTRKTKIYFQSLLPTNSDFSDFKNHQNKTAHILNVNTQLKALCQNKNVVFVNLYDHFTDEKGKLSQRYTNDGLHLTGAGYQKWKEILLKGKYL